MRLSFADGSAHSLALVAPSKASMLPAKRSSAFYLVLSFNDEDGKVVAKVLDAEPWMFYDSLLLDNDETSRGASTSSSSSSSVSSSSSSSSLSTSSATKGGYAKELCRRLRLPVMKLASFVTKDLELTSWNHVEDADYDIFNDVNV